MHAIENIKKGSIINNIIERSVVRRNSHGGGVGLQMEKKIIKSGPSHEPKTFPKHFKLEKAYMLFRAPCSCISFFLSNRKRNH